MNKRVARREAVLKHQDQRRIGTQFEVHGFKRPVPTLSAIKADFGCDVEKLLMPTLPPLGVASNRQATLSNAFSKSANGEELESA